MRVARDSLPIKDRVVQRAQPRTVRICGWLKEGISQTRDHLRHG